MIRHPVFGALGVILMLAACGGPVVQATGPQRATTFVPASEVTGSALATDRVIKIDEKEEAELATMGAIKIGVLTIYDPFTSTSGSPKGEAAVWPGASVDAAGLGATHARLLKVEGSNDQHEGAVKVAYALYHFSPQRWSALPDALKPAPLAVAGDARVVTWSAVTRDTRR